MEDDVLKKKAGFFAALLMSVSLLCLGGGGLFWLVSTVGYNFIHMADRAKTSEAIFNLDEIRAAQQAYHTEHGVYVAAALQPEPEADGRMKPFVVAEGSGWKTLGWPTTDFFRCQYEVSLEGEGYRAVARCDVDQDGDYALFEGTQDEAGKRLSSDRSF